MRGKKRWGCIEMSINRWLVKTKGGLPARPCLICIYTSNLAESVNVIFQHVFSTVIEYEGGLGLKSGKGRLLPFLTTEFIHKNFPISFLERNAAKPNFYWESKENRKKGGREEAGVLKPGSINLSRKFSGGLPSTLPTFLNHTNSTTQKLFFFNIF